VFHPLLSINKEKVHFLVSSPFSYPYFLYERGVGNLVLFTYYSRIAFYDLEVRVFLLLDSKAKITGWYTIYIADVLHPFFMV
jgi:hypothetical protein